MTPNQARAARAMLNLPIAAVCESTSVGKRTLTEFEAGIRNINDSTRSKIVAFYIAHGISFQTSKQLGDAVTLRAPEIPIATEKNPSNLLEFIDHFSVETINNDLNSLRDALARLRSSSNFSRTFLSLVLRRSNINQKALAELTGCSAAHISAIMIGKKTLSVALAKRLSDLNCTQDVYADGVILAEREIDALLHVVPMHIDRSANAIASIYPDASS